MKGRASPQRERACHQVTCRRCHRVDRDMLEGFPVRDPSGVPVLFMNEKEEGHVPTGTRVLILSFSSLISSSFSA